MISEKNYVTSILRSSCFRCQGTSEGRLKVMEGRSDKFGEAICTTFVFLTTYLPRNTCRLFARAQWRCPIRSVWLMLSWLNCDSNPVRRFAGTRETRWNPRAQVPSSQTTPGSRSNRAQFWPVSRSLQSKQCRAGMAWGTSSSSSTRRERIYLQPLQNRTKNREVKVSI